VIVTASRVSTPEHLANLAPATAWTQRRLVFEGRPLGEVAEEFNRYNRETIRIDDPGLQHQEVSGVFQANDPESFMAFLSEIPGVKIHKTKDGSSVVTLQGEPTPGTADPH
jgi:ferric-dicitrate binding protein FerR (iron transport regulator)